MSDPLGGCKRRKISGELSEVDIPEDGMVRDLTVTSEEMNTEDSTMREIKELRQKNKQLHAESKYQREQIANLTETIKSLKLTLKVANPSLSDQVAPAQLTTSRLTVPTASSSSIPTRIDDVEKIMSEEEDAAPLNSAQCRNPRKKQVSAKISSAP